MQTNSLDVLNTWGLSTVLLKLRSSNGALSPSRGSECLNPRRADLRLTAVLTQHVVALETMALQLVHYNRLDLSRRVERGDPACRLVWESPPRHADMRYREAGRHPGTHTPGPVRAAQVTCCGDFAIHGNVLGYK